MMSVKSLHDHYMKKEMSINELAVMVKQGFDSVDKRFDGVDKRLDKVDQEIAALKQGQENIELKLCNVAYRFELEELKQRVVVLEKALKQKSAKR